MINEKIKSSLEIIKSEIDSLIDNEVDLVEELPDALIDVLAEAHSILCEVLDCY